MHDYQGKEMLTAERDEQGKEDNSHSGILDM